MRTSGTNLEHARAHNRRVIIEAIRLHGELTRAELARLTALTAQTVSNIVADKPWTATSGTRTARYSRHAESGQCVFNRYSS